MRLARTTVASLMALAVVTCAGAHERTLLDQFFAASRLRDLTALRKCATVVFEPASDGIVTSYEITSIAGRGATKEVLITAPVKMSDGRIVTRHLAVTIERGLVTAISEPPVLSPTTAAAAPSTPRP